MLSRTVRLRNSRDINRVYARGRFGGASALHVKVLKNNLEHARATIVVGKKVNKKSVVRNTIRRRLSGALEAEWQHVTPGCDIVISVREDVSQAPAGDLKQQLTAALTKAGAMEAKNV